MSKRKRIGLDFDDCLIDFNSSFCEFHNNNYGTYVKRSDVFDYSLDKVYGCSKEEMLDRIISFFNSSYHKSIEPIDGAVKFVDEFSKDNDLFIITARPEISKSPTEELINKFFPKLNNFVYFTDPHLSLKKKSDVCKELGIQTFIEDAPIHAEDLSASIDEVLLYNTPWNTEYKGSSNVRRVFSWSEVLDLV